MGRRTLVPRLRLLLAQSSCVDSAKQGNTGGTDIFPSLPKILGRIELPSSRATGLSSCYNCSTARLCTRWFTWLSNVSMLFYLYLELSHDDFASNPCILFYLIIILTLTQIIQQCCLPLIPLSEYCLLLLHLSDHQLHIRAC